jgi:hypothetical protein
MLSICKKKMKRQQETDCEKGQGNDTKTRWNERISYKIKATKNSIHISRNDNIEQFIKPTIMYVLSTSSTAERNMDEQFTSAANLD